MFLTTHILHLYAMYIFNKLLKQYKQQQGVFFIFCFLILYFLLN
jgi:hypothetical protein